MKSKTLKLCGEKSAPINGETAFSALNEFMDAVAGGGASGEIGGPALAGADQEYAVLGGAAIGLIVRLFGEAPARRLLDAYLSRAGGEPEDFTRSGGVSSADSDSNASDRLTVGLYRLITKKLVPMAQRYAKHRDRDRAKLYTEGFLI